MDVGTVIGAVTGVVALMFTAAGALVSYGVQKRSLKANEDNLAALREELKRADAERAAEVDRLQREIEKAQSAAGQANAAAAQVGGLAQAVEHMGQRFADQIKHLVETMTLNDQHTRSRLDDIKEELRFVRSKPRTSRPTADA